LDGVNGTGLYWLYGLGGKNYPQWPIWRTLAGFLFPIGEMSLRTLEVDSGLRQDLPLFLGTGL